MVIDDSHGGSEQLTQRRELADLLRSRRDCLTPDDVGLPAGTRLRAPGLRREEVAQLAGVSITYYTFLEQGRDVRPSQQVLAALAAALRTQPGRARPLVPARRDDSAVGWRAAG